MVSVLESLGRCCGRAFRKLRGRDERERGEAFKCEVERAPAGKQLRTLTTMNRSMENSDERQAENAPEEMIDCHREENEPILEMNERSFEEIKFMEMTERREENEPVEMNERREENEPIEMNEPREENELGEENERGEENKRREENEPIKMNDRREENELMEMNECREENEPMEMNEPREENEPIEMHERSFEEIKMTDRREENEPMEMNERCEESQLKLQRILAPKRIPRRPPKKKKMLKEDWRIKSEELEANCSDLTQQLEECRGRSLQSEELEARCSDLMKQLEECRGRALQAEHLEAQCSGLTKQLEECRGAFSLNKLPLLASCKCHFFSTANQTTTYDDYVAQSPVQIFLRNVRYLRRLNHQTRVGNNDEVQEPLTMVIDFVIELSCQTKPIHLTGRYAEVYVHHAVNLITDTIPLLHDGNEDKRATVDNLVAKLLLNLVEKLLNFSSDLTTTSSQDSAESAVDDREKILAIMLSLAECGYIGHRMLLTSSHEIAMVLERLQCMDPFDEGFSQIFENLFFMFDLVETLVAAHMTSWKEENNFSQGILEEWVTCHFHCKTTLERQPTAWTTQLMIVLDNITAKLLEQLHRSAESDGQETWQKALVHLLASAASAIT